MTSLQEWIQALPGDGHFTFTTAEARAQQPHITAAGTEAALGRASAAGLIASPVRGFHVVLPLEDRRTGIPQWRLFLDPLMIHLGLRYYVGLLTAAAIYGASAQIPQIVQVVAARQHRPISLDRLRIEFVVRSRAADAPVVTVTTPTGYLRVATCEVVALDLVRYPDKGGGWGNILTVLRDLAPQLTRAGTRAALTLRPTGPELQRLGHLLDRVGARASAGVIEQTLVPRRLGWVPLDPGAPASEGEASRNRDATRDTRWRVIVNVDVTAD